MIAKSLIAVGFVASITAVVLPVPVTAAGPPLVPVLPARVLETRPGEITVDGAHQGVGRRTAGTTYELDIAGRAGVPADAQAVMINTTAVFPDGPGFLTVFPCGQTLPTASSLNYTAGQVVANAVLAKLGTNGRICIYTHAATDIIVDVNGYVPATGSPSPLVPARVLETRPGEITVDGAHQGVGRRTAGTTYELDIAGRAGVPADAQAVMINTTAVFPDGPGFLTVFPCGQTLPTASSLNYTAGQVVANAVLAKLGTNGRICIYTHAATDIIVDVNGYVPATGSPSPLVPARVLETRPGEITVDGAHQGVGRRTAGTTYELDIAGRAGVPADAQAVMINTTAVFPDGPGFLTVFPCGQTLPTASSLNYTAGQVVANAVLAKLGTNGRICIYTHAATDIIVDVNGYVSPAVVVPVIYVTVDAGSDHACGVTTSGAVRCWGNNAEGQLGNGSTSSNGTSVPVSGLDDVTAIAAGDGHTSAIVSNGDVYCWGRNTQGQLGDSSTVRRLTPVKVSGISNASRLDAAVGYTCVIEAGSVSCWGINHVGQLGDGTTDERHTPVQVGGVTTAIEIEAGRYHTCVATGAGNVQCWGDNVGGMLGVGVGPGSFSTVAVTAAGVSDAIGVAAGYGHTCAMSELGTASCWGNNNAGQLGNGSNVHSYPPVAVSGLTGATAVTSDFTHTCAVTGGVIRCWGGNNAGQLGNGATGGYSDVPVGVVDLAGVSSIDAGFNFTCAVAYGTAYCWGGNNFGQLGNGSYNNSDEPVAVL